MESLREMNHKINRIMGDTDVLYHEAALKLGVSDSEMRLLYTIRDHGSSCLLGELYKQCGLSKQTANSAINRMVEGGLLVVGAGKKRDRIAELTEKGLLHANATVDRLICAEEDVLKKRTEAETEMYLRFLEGYYNDLKVRIETL